MKGIIVDRKGRYAVALTGDGSFMKIHNKAQYKLGYEIEFDKSYKLEKGLLAKVSSIAAVFLFALGLSYGVYSYTAPYSYVDFDINPSIELTANIYDIIIKTETFNEDGKKLLEKHKLNFKKLGTGVAELVDSAIEQGYLKDQAGNAVLLTITSKDERKTEKLEKHVEDVALKALDESNVDSDVISQQVSSQKHDIAKDMGISPGKLNLIEKAQEANPGLMLENLKDDSVKVIMEYIKDSRKEEKPDNNSNKQDDKGDRKEQEDKKEQKDQEDKKQDKENEKQSREIEQDKEDNKDKVGDKDKEDNLDKKSGKDKEIEQDKEDKQQDKQTKAIDSTDQDNGQSNMDKDSGDKDKGEKSDKEDENEQKSDKDDKDPTRKN